MLVFVTEFVAEPVQKKLPGVAAMEFLYYMIKNSNHSCEEISKEKGNNILASLYRLVKNLEPILQWQHKMGDLQTNCTSNASIKVQIFVYRPGEALKASRISRQLAHEGDKIVSLIYLLFSFTLTIKWLESQSAPLQLLMPFTSELCLPSINT